MSENLRQVHVRFPGSECEMRFSFCPVLNEDGTITWNGYVSWNPGASPMNVVLAVQNCASKDVAARQLFMRIQRHKLDMAAVEREIEKYVAKTETERTAEYIRANPGLDE